MARLTLKQLNAKAGTKFTRWEQVEQYLQPRKPPYKYIYGLDGSSEGELYLAHLEVFECYGCGARYDAAHEDDVPEKGRYSCPFCAEAERVSCEK